MVETESKNKGLNLSHMKMEVMVTSKEADYIKMYHPSKWHIAKTTQTIEISWNSVTSEQHF
uniref:Uncharacterized protein n=1 Tax=Arion vulgaris TaxID=1028688 RepID=A0A0B7ARQ5_9EUPU